MQSVSLTYVQLLHIRMTISALVNDGVAGGVTYQLAKRAEKYYFLAAIT